MRREIDAYGARAKLRSPLATLGLTLLTLGIYGVVWYHRVNSELRDYGRAYHDDDLAGSDPTASALALVPGFLLILPPLISAVGFVGRVRRVQRYGQSELLSGWLVATMIVLPVFLPAIPGYVQSTLNELWRRYPDADASPERKEARTESEAGRLRRLWDWIVGPPRESTPPPEWVFSPVVAVLALAVSYLLFQTDAGVLALAPQIYFAVQVYEDRRSQGLSHLWWSSAVGTVGSLVFLMYIGNRRETLVNMGHGRPGATGAQVGAEAAQAAALPAAAWYPDPWGRATLRWWDGTEWTGYVNG
jgi:hypothetical protein